MQQFHGCGIHIQDEPCRDRCLGAVLQVTEVYKVILGAQLLVAICPEGRAQFEYCGSCNKKSYGFNLYVLYAGKDGLTSGF